MEKSLDLLPLNIENINKLFNKSIENLDDILNNMILKDLGIKQGIIYNYDSLMSGEIGDLNLDKDNVIEARLFNEEIEIVLINEENLRGHIVIEKNKDLLIEEDYEIYHNCYNKLKVKKYLDIDEDGQAYIKYLKPCKLYKKGAK